MSFVQHAFKSYIFLLCAGVGDSWQQLSTHLALWMVLQLVVVVAPCTSVTQVMRALISGWKKALHTNKTAVDEADTAVLTQ
jgi:hypothetical protein